MVRVVGADGVQVSDQFRGDSFGLGVVETVHDAVGDGIEGGPADAAVNELEQGVDRVGGAELLFFAAVVFTIEEARLLGADALHLAAT